MTIKHERKHSPRVQTTRLVSFGPIFVVAALLVMYFIVVIVVVVVGVGVVVVVDVDIVVVWSK